MSIRVGSGWNQRLYGGRGGWGLSLIVDDKDGPGDGQGGVEIEHYLVPDEAEAIAAAFLEGARRCREEEKREELSPGGGS